MIVAIDGPAGSGKSSTARALAERTGFLYLDTGAMYRAVALCVLETGTKATDQSVREIMEQSAIEISSTGSGMAISVDGRDVTDMIRSREVTNMSSIVSALPAVRERLVEEQRRIARRESAKGGGVILEGRDIGTVVFPDADVKIYLDAEPRERARRRLAEWDTELDVVDEDTVEAEILERDRRDRARDLSPLKKADDALLIDTTRLTLQEQIDCIESLIREQKSRL